MRPSLSDSGDGTGSQTYFRKEMIVPSLEAGDLKDTVEKKKSDALTL